MTLSVFEWCRLSTPSVIEASISFEWNPLFQHVSLCVAGSFEYDLPFLVDVVLDAFDDLRSLRPE